jgi:hypothetical protein
MPTQELPGVEGEGVAVKRIKPLDNAIAEWRDAVAKRMTLTEDEVFTCAKVVELMHKYQLTTYPYYDDDDMKKNVVLEGSEKLKLKKVKEKKSSDDDDKDDDKGED